MDELRRAFLMASDPLPDTSVDEVRARFADKNGEKDLADAYAMAENKLALTAYELNDHNVGSPERTAFGIIYDGWECLAGEYEERIFEIMKRENPLISDMGDRSALKPFMERYGYIDGGGLWIKTIRSSDETF